MTNTEQNTNTFTIRFNNEIQSRLDFLQNKFQLSKAAIIKLAITRMFEEEIDGDDWLRKSYNASTKQEAKEIVVKIIMEKVKEIAGDKRIKINLRGNVDE